MGKWRRTRSRKSFRWFNLLHVEKINPVLTGLARGFFAGWEIGSDTKLAGWEFPSLSSWQLEFCS